MEQNRQLGVRDRASFTLLEVLIVLAIIGFVVALLVPTLSAARERGRIVTCLNNLKQLTFAHLMYAQDQNQRMCTANDALTTTPPGWLLGPSVPTVVTNSILVQRGYISQPTQMFKCPTDKGKRTDPQHIVPAIFSYARNGEILEQYPDSASQVSPNLGDIKYPAKTMMLMELHDSHPFNDGTTMRWPVDWITDRHLGQGGMSFFDGHVVMIKASEYNALSPDDKVDRYLNPIE